MNRELYHMIDIETTGVDKDNDDILEIAIVQIKRNGCGFWELTSKENFHRKIYSDKKPETEFAKKYMVALYDECNHLNPERDDVGSVSESLRVWLHGEENYNREYQEPKFFMGWNASNFDLEFCFKKGLLEPSRYELLIGKEELVGDAHYRVYEQTGAIEYICDVRGWGRKTIMSMCEDILDNNPPWKLTLPEGKLHNALYDCYSQINMMNALIHIGRVH